VWLIEVKILSEVCGMLWLYLAKEICDKIHLQSDAASDERLLLEDVQKILVRLGSVEAQVSSCRQMFETSKAQEQQNLDRNSAVAEISWIFQT